MAFDANPSVLPQAQGGEIRALGAAWRTYAALPDLPTMQEQGMQGFECYTWNAILAPAARRSRSSIGSGGVQKAMEIRR